MFFLGQPQLAIMKLLSRVYTVLVFCFTSSLLFAQTWSKVGNGLGDSVHGMTVYDGRLVLGGSFGVNLSGCIIEFDSTNFVNTVDDNIGIVVRDVHVWNNNLIAVGDFWNAPPPPSPSPQPCTGCNGAARWDGASWQPLGTGMDNDVLCIGEYEGDLVIGGDFESVDGNSAIQRIGRWNGSSWNYFDPYNPPDTVFRNDIRAIAVYDNELFVGGDFNNASGSGSADGLAKWKVDSLKWKGIVKPGGIDSTVRALFVDDGKLYIGGHFRQILGDSSMSGIVCWDGDNLTSLGTGINDGYVRAIVKYHGELYVGGEFTMAGGIAAESIARWDGTQWKACGGGVDLGTGNGNVKSLQVYKDELYVGGAFTRFDGSNTNSPHIARWHTPVPPPPTMSLSLGSSSDISCADLCDGAAKVLAAGTGGYAYLWNDPAAQTVFF